ncbi:MAG: PAS domain S-box protein [Deltaproteobacteria bacterium]|nr:PAS domain S-box protein [Deltaproteobacteria bacterium]
MSDDGKTRRQLLEELALLRDKVKELEGAAVTEPGAKIKNASKKRKGTAFKLDTAEAQASGEIEALVRLCLDKVPDGVCLTSSGGRILYVNAPAAHNLGYEVTELTGKFMGGLGPKATRGAWKMIWSEIKQKSSCFYETRHRRKDGSFVPVEVMASHIAFRGMEYGFFHSHNISGRKSIEHNLAAQKNFYEKIFETVNDGIWVTSPQDVITYANKGMTEIAGIPKSKIIGLNVLRDFPEATLSNFRPLYRQARETLQPLQYEVSVVTPSNRETWQAGWLMPQTLKGSFNGMLCTIQDVTIKKQEEELYRTLLKTMKAGISIVDMQGRILEVNDAFCAISGYGREELVRMGIGDIEAGIQPREIAASIRKIKKIGGEVFEARHRRKDGSLIDVEVNVAFVGTGEGRMVTLVRDITWRKRMENELRQSEAVARTLLQIPSTVMMLLDTQARFIEVNETMTKRFCRTREEMIGMCLWDILPPHVAKLRKGYFARALSTAEMVRWEDERQGMWNDNSFIPIANERGTIEQVIGFAIDITAGKKAEIHLAESEKRYRQIFETCAEGILAVDIESKRVKYANPAMCALLGYTLRGLQRKRLSDIHPESAMEEVNSQFAEIARGFTINAPAIACQHKDGSVIYADISGTKMVIDEHAYNVGFFTDITQRRAVEQKLQKSEELFRETFEHAPIGIAIFDKRGGVVNANSFIAGILGYAKDTLKAEGIDAYLHAEDKLMSIKALLASPEKLRRHAVHEKRYVARDGHTAYVKEYTQGIFTKADELLFLIVLIEDITGRMQAEILNINVIAKLKDVYKELHDFSAMLPAEQKFSRLVSIHDYNLSPMENRVASLIYNSYTNHKIASKLNISENTVKHHITSIFSKFKVGNRLEFLKIIREKRIVI